MPECTDTVKTQSNLRTGFFALLIMYSLIVFAYGVYGALTGSADLKSFHKTSELLLKKTNPYDLTINYIENEGYNISSAGLKKAAALPCIRPLRICCLYHSMPFSCHRRLPVFHGCFGILYFWGSYIGLSARAIKTISLLAISTCLSVMLIGAASTKTNLSLGQTTLFSLAAFVLTLSFQERSKWLSGLAFALAISKPSLMILFVFYLLFKKEFRILIIAFSLHLCPDCRRKHLDWSIANNLDAELFQTNRVAYHTG